jgi:hypothetical protein
VFKTISEPTVRLAQTVHLSYTDTNTVSKRTEMRFHMTHITEVFYQVCPKRFSSLWYARCKTCTYLAQYYVSRQTDQNEIPHDLGHLGVLSGVSKVIFEPVVRSAQTVHLSCVKNSTLSKRTETSIHLSLVTLEYDRVRSK